MDAQANEIGSRFLTKWVLFTAGACILGLPLPFLMNDLAAIPLAAALVGLAQWLVLRERLPISGLWVLASAVGLGLPRLLGEIIDRAGFVPGLHAGGASQAIGVAAVAATGGLLIGLFQVPLLKPHFARTAPWVVASAIGWGIFSTTLRFNPLEVILRQPIDLSFEVSAVLGVLLTALAVFVSLAVGPLLLAIVTGIGLSWTAKHPADHGRQIGGLSHR